MTETSDAITSNTQHIQFGKIEGVVRWGGHGRPNPKKQWIYLPSKEVTSFPHKQSIEVACIETGCKTARRIDLRPGATLTGPVFYRTRKFSGSLKARAHAPIVLGLLILLTLALAYSFYVFASWPDADRWTKLQYLQVYYSITVTPILALLWAVFLRHILVVAPALKRSGILQIQTPPTVHNPE